MDSQAKLQHLLKRLRSTRDEVEAEIERLLERQRRQFQYTQERGRIIFDRQIAKLHRRARIGNLRYILSASFATLITAPIIYGMVLPIALLDLTISLYQHICFRVYRIPRVRRHEYVVIDRHRLPYLNAIQKLNCMYCGYGNGVMAYAREVVARTEQYWCPIKHARRSKGLHEREAKFFDYGDAEAWRDQLQVIRCDWDDIKDGA
jgi:hypothetical protein